MIQKYFDANNIKVFLKYMQFLHFCNILKYKVNCINIIFLIIRITKKKCDHIPCIKTVGKWERKKKDCKEITFNMLVV